MKFQMKLFALASVFALAATADARPLRSCANGSCSMNAASFQIVEAPPVVLQSAGCQGGSARASGCSGGFASSARSGLFDGGRLFHGGLFNRQTRNTTTVIVASRPQAQAPSAARPTVVPTVAPAVIADEFLVNFVDDEPVDEPAPIVILMEELDPNTTPDPPPIGS